MLRTALIGLVLFMLAAAIIVSMQGSAPLYGPISALLVILAGLLFERHQYRALAQQKPEVRFSATGEKFIDPESGSPVTVYQDPATCERRYVVDQPD